MKKHTSETLGTPQIKQAAVIGCPIQHSKSPLIHQHMIDAYQLKAVYSSIEVSNIQELKQCLEQLRAPEWAGINVTIPHKQAVIPYLDSVSKEVQAIGACNTIVNKQGQLYGYNTDAEGFAYPLQGRTVANTMVLGNGGAARAVLYQLCVMGVKSIDLVARDHSKSDAYCNALQQQFNVTIQPNSFKTVQQSNVQSAALIINTTSIGLSPNDTPFDFIKQVSNGQVFYDLIYNPAETAMMALCKQQGAEVINGAPMLAHQAALAFNLFFDHPADTQIMLNVLEGHI
jgi:shikimate dehydrogenase